MPLIDCLTDDIPSMFWLSSDAFADLIAIELLCFGFNFGKSLGRWIWAHVSQLT